MEISSFATEQCVYTNLFKVIDEDGKQENWIHTYLKVDDECYLICRETASPGTFGVFEWFVCTTPYGMGLGGAPNLECDTMWEGVSSSERKLYKVEDLSWLSTANCIKQKLHFTLVPPATVETATPPGELVSDDDRLAIIEYQHKRLRDFSCTKTFTKEEAWLELYCNRQREEQQQIPNPCTLPTSNNLNHLSTV